MFDATPPPEVPTFQESRYESQAPADCKVTLQEILKKKSTSKAKDGDLRDDAVREEAFAAGAQRGLSARTTSLYGLLESMAGELDSLFNFKILMDDKIMPPVITEAKETFVQEGDGQSARASQRTWEILVPAKILAQPPNWRDYIMTFVPEPSHVDSVFLPRNDRETKLWEKSFCDGYNEGFAQGNLAFTENLNRLTRDFLGIIRFQILAAQNIISKPVMEEGRLGITSQGKRMFVDDRVYKITTPSGWQTSATWSVTNPD